MKILQVFKTYLPDTFGGVERVLHEVAEGTTALGFENRVLSLSAKPNPGGIPIDHHWAHSAKLHFDIASTGLSFSVGKLFRQLAAKADVIHYHFPWPVMDVLQLTSSVHKPSIVTYHSDVVKQHVLLQAYYPLMHRFLGSVDKIVATSPQYIESSPVLQRYRDKTAVIPLGVTDVPPPASDLVESWRRRVGDRFFLFIGKFRYYKGIEFLLQAATATGWPVVVAGDGDARRRIEHAAPSNVTLVGAVNDADKLALLQLCTALVLPSHLRSEAFGVVLLEASRASKPMITCDIGTGTSYANVDGVTGMVVPPADVGALAGAMQTLCRNPAAAAAMGTAARQRFEYLFGAETMCKQYADVYRAIARLPRQVTSGLRYGTGSVP